MHWLKQLFVRRRRYDDVAVSIREHLEDKIEDLMENGMSRDAATQAARREFGNVTLMEERSREVWQWQMLESLWADTKYAGRQLKKSPGFALAAILTLALGIGANAAIFQLLDAVRLRSLPVVDPQSLALIHIEGGTRGFGISVNDNMLSYAVWQEIQRHQEGFSGVFAWADANIHLGSGADTRLTHSVWVTGDAFSTLGVLPVRGRLFNKSDDHPDCGTSSAVISYGFWQSQFGGSDSTVGSIVTLDGHPTQIIGISPPRFSGIDVGRNFDVALPLCSLTSYHPSAQALSRRDFSFLTVMGRVKPGWTLAQASAQLRGISPAIFQSTEPTGYAAGAHPFYTSFRLGAYPAANGISDLRGTYDSALWLLLGITALVLLIACANLASLMLVRATARQQEMAVRLAIGASRLCLVRQLLMEGVLIAALGAAIGIGIAKLLSKIIVVFLGGGQNAPYLDLSLDWRILGFLAFVASMTCLIFGLIPAFRASQVSPIEAIKSRTQGRSASRRHSSFQKSLVVTQIAISLVLVVGAICFVRSFRSLMTLNAGFDRNDLIVASVDFSHISMRAKRNEPFLESLVAAVQSLPNVGSAAASTHTPLDGSSWSLGIRVGEKDGSSKYTWVTPGYFRTMRMQILAGRDFNERDTSTSPPVAIVNQTFVREFVGGANPIGKVVLSRAEPNYPAIEYQIIGVVNDAKYADLREQIPPQAFVPESQFSAAGASGTIFIRGNQPSSSVMPAVRARLEQISPQIQTEFALFQTRVDDGLVRERLMAALSGFFGIIATLLAAIGLYGVISYIVAGRNGEIGIRLALGATRDMIALQIVREAAAPVCLGLFLGFPIAMIAIRSANSLFFGLGANSWTSFCAAGLFLLAVALGASWIPARRASRLDPMNALRSE